MLVYIVIYAYNIAPLGPGQYDIGLKEVGTTFYSVDPRTRRVTIVKAAVAHDNLTASISENFVVAPKHSQVASSHRKAHREPLAGCTTAQVDVVQAPIPIIVDYVNAAQQYMRDPGGHEPLNSKWFGIPDFSGESIIATALGHMSDKQFNTFTYNCGAFASDCTDPDDVAYVEPGV